MRGEERRWRGGGEGGERGEKKIGGGRRGREGRREEGERDGGGDEQVLPDIMYGSGAVITHLLVKSLKQTFSLR